MSDSITRLSGFLQQTSMRHGVIASNIANVDTPGYKAKDASFEKVFGAEIQLATTRKNHIVIDESSSASALTEMTETKPWLDQNTVELDQEVAKMTENAMLHQAGIKLLSAKIKMFKAALRTTG